MKSNLALDPNTLAIVEKIARDLKREALLDGRYQAFEVLHSLVLKLQVMADENTPDEE